MSSSPHAQSAMEYLMTYGWAILIILIVLGVLYLLGVFSPNSILGGQCNVQFKYSCTGFALATNGTASFLLGQNTGRDEFNIAVACTAGINSTGGPYAGTSPWIYLNASGTEHVSYSPSSAFRLNSGSSVQVNATPCYSTDGAALGTHPIGTTFDGYLWMEYTTAPGPEGGANGWVIQRVATIYAAVGRTGGSSTAATTTTTVGYNTTSTSSVSTTTTTTTTTISVTYATAKGSADPGPLSVSLTNPYSLHICSGAVGSALSVTAPIMPSWSVDIEDSNPWGAIGRNASGVCSASVGSSLGIAIAEVGLNDAPTPTVSTNATQASGIIKIQFTASSGDFVVVMGACGGLACNAPNLPSGTANCTLAQTAASGDGSETAYAAVCKPTATATYNANLTWPPIACERGFPCSPATSIAAYVFPSYSPTLSS